MSCQAGHVPDHLPRRKDISLLLRSFLPPPRLPMYCCCREATSITWTDHRLRHPEPAVQYKRDGGPGADRGVESTPKSKMSDAIVVEEPIQSTSLPSPTSSKQSQVADPEGVNFDDGQNPEFKLPKMSSLVMVLMTNALMQVQ